MLTCKHVQARQNMSLRETSNCEMILGRLKTDSHILESSCPRPLPPWQQGILLKRCVFLCGAMVRV